MRNAGASLGVDLFRKLNPRGSCPFVVGERELFCTSCLTKAYEKCLMTAYSMSDLQETTMASSLWGLHTAPSLGFHSLKRTLPKLFHTNALQFSTVYFRSSGPLCYYTAGCHPWLGCSVFLQAYLFGVSYSVWRRCFFFLFILKDVKLNFLYAYF